MFACTAYVAGSGHRVDQGLRVPVDACVQAFTQTYVARTSVGCESMFICMRSAWHKLDQGIGMCVPGHEVRRVSSFYTNLCCMRVCVCLHGMLGVWHGVDQGLGVHLDVCKPLRTCVYVWHTPVLDASQCSPAWRGKWHGWTRNSGCLWTCVCRPLCKHLGGIHLCWMRVCVYPHGEEHARCMSAWNVHTCMWCADA